MFVKFAVLMVIAVVVACGINHAMKNAFAENDEPSMLAVNKW